MVRWYSFDHFRQNMLQRVKYMNKIKVSVLKHVLCSLMSKSDFSNKNA
jgi:hypothetical protein